MKRPLYKVVLSLVVIMMISFSVSAEKFAFSLVDISTIKNDVVDNISVDKPLLLPSIDFGTFEVGWEASGYDKAIIYISYDREAWEISRYPYSKGQLSEVLSMFINKYQPEWPLIKLMIGYGV